MTNYLRIMGLCFSLPVIIALFGFLTTVAEAGGTPDGETPAVETCCDGLVGAPFGLCNAYCEAMDCDSQEGYDQHPNDCDEVLGNYQKKTGVDGPPCDCGGICFDTQSICIQGCGSAVGGCLITCGGGLECISVCFGQFFQCLNGCFIESHNCDISLGCCDQNCDIEKSLCLDGCDEADSPQECSIQCEAVADFCHNDLCAPID